MFLAYIFLSEGFPKFKIFPISNFSQLGQRGGGSLNFQFFPNSKKSKLLGGRVKKIVDFFHFLGPFIFRTLPLDINRNFTEVYIVPLILNLGNIPKNAMLFQICQIFLISLPVLSKVPLDLAGVFRPNGNNVPGVNIIALTNIIVEGCKIW